MFSIGHTMPFRGSVWPILGISFIGVINALLLVFASDGSIGVQLSSVLLVACIGALATAWIFLDKKFNHISIFSVFFLALLVRCIAVQASPLLEDDQYRYLWDGYRTATSFDPYHSPPSAYFESPEVSAFWKDILFSINNPDITTIYGPLLQWLFALAYSIAAGSTAAIQWLLLIVDMVIIALLSFEKIERKYLLAYAINPLVIKEAMATAHPDGLVALFFVIAILCWRRQQVYVVGLVLALAIATKISALLAVPFFCFTPVSRPQKNQTLTSAVNIHSWLHCFRISLVKLLNHFSFVWLLKLGIVLSITTCALYLPFLIFNEGASDSKALEVFSQKWRFNPLGYYFFDILFPTDWERIASGVTIMALCGVIFYKWQAYRRETSPVRLELPPIDYLFLALLFFSPVVNPWYWLWALAPSLLLGSRLIIIVSLGAMLSYLNTTVFADIAQFAHLAADSQFRVAWPARVMQIGIIIFAVVIELKNHKHSLRKIDSILD